jgi:hypothetical protein
MFALSSFVRLLDDAAEMLQPFVKSARPGCTSSNVEYASVTETVEPDPYALAWFSSLRTMSGLLSRQASLSAEQYSYLERELFGGMGSFQDFSLDPNRWGKTADAANDRLGRIRDELYASLVSLRDIVEPRPNPTMQPTRESSRSG